jgi:hypothetical protein
MKTMGLEGAVTGIHGYATAHRFRQPDGAFHVARFAFPDDLTYLCQYVTGLERFKLLVRGLD